MMEQNYSTAILCGGKSSRMKTDKALIEWGGKPLALYIVDGFPSCDDVFLSVADPDQFDLPAIRMTADKYTGCGPLAGLVASLEYAKHDILFVTTCDAPLIDEQSADIITGLLSGYDAVVPKAGDLIHPLTAVYRRSVLEQAVLNIKKGTFKMGMFLEKLNVNYIDAGILPYGEETLTNLNTPEELKCFIQSQISRRRH